MELWQYWIATEKASILVILILGEKYSDFTTELWCFENVSELFLFLPQRWVKFCYMTLLNVYVCFYSLHWCVVCWFLMLISIIFPIDNLSCCYEFLTLQRADEFSWEISFQVWCQWRCSRKISELHLADLSLHFTFYLSHPQTSLLYCHIVHIICILNHFCLILLKYCLSNIASFFLYVLQSY